MATWVTHFRIAETLLLEEPGLHRTGFIVGNIGPDCGLVGEDGKPTPPKTVTHFMTDGQIRSDLFADVYMQDLASATDATRSYLLGYYLHLVTDECFSAFTQLKKQEPVVKQIVGTPDYTRLVKTDWYGIDFRYLATHPTHLFWTDFRHIESFTDQLPYFPEGQTMRQIQNITTFYETHSLPEDHVFRYMTPNEIDKFIDETLVVLRERMQPYVGQVFT